MLHKTHTYFNANSFFGFSGGFFCFFFRKVNKDDIVILDSLNYIKGKSYYLFCNCHSYIKYCDL